MVWVSLAYKQKPILSFKCHRYWTLIIIIMGRWGQEDLVPGTTVVCFQLQSTRFYNVKQSVWLSLLHNRAWYFQSRAQNYFERYKTISREESCQKQAHRFRIITVEYVTNLHEAQCLLQAYIPWVFHIPPILNSILFKMTFWPLPWNVK